MNILLGTGAGKQASHWSMIYKAMMNTLGLDLLSSKCLSLMTETFIIP